MGRTLLPLALALACTRSGSPDPPPTEDPSPAPVTSPAPAAPSPAPAPPPPPAPPPIPGPTFLSGPDRTYRCTRYVADPEPKPGAALAITLPPDKPMKFRLAARPTPATRRKGKVVFEGVSLPPGATLSPDGRFTWKTAGTAGQQIAFALAAVGPDGGRTEWPITITIADDKLRTAWRAGMGSPSPDCDLRIDTRWEVADFDGDGHDDAMWRVIEDEEETAINTHVKLWRKGGFSDALEVLNRVPEFATATDGTRLAIMWEDCCFTLELDVARLEGDEFVPVDTHWQVSHGDPDGESTDLTLLYDAKGRIRGLEETSPSGTTRYRWRDGDFESL